MSFDPDEIGFQHPTTATSPIASIFAQDLPLTPKKRFTFRKCYTVDISVRFRASHPVGELTLGLGLGSTSYVYIRMQNIGAIFDLNFNYMYDWNAGDQ
jgi:hypothetical protein